MSEKKNVDFEEVKEKEVTEATDEKKGTIIDAFKGLSVPKKIAVCGGCMLAVAGGIGIVLLGREKMMEKSIIDGVADVTKEALTDAVEEAATTVAS